MSVLEIGGIKGRGEETTARAAINGPIIRKIDPKENRKIEAEIGEFASTGVVCRSLSILRSR